MATRAAGKSRKNVAKLRPAPGKGRVKAVSVPAAKGAAGRDRSLQEECEQLRAELAKARGRIAELEAQRETVVNRIDWVIDSLHTLLEE